MGRRQYLVSVNDSEVEDLERALELSGAWWREVEVRKLSATVATSEWLQRYSHLPREQVERETLADMLRRYVMVEGHDRFDTTETVEGDVHAKTFHLHIFAPVTPWRRPYTSEDVEYEDL